MAAGSKDLAAQPQQACTASGVTSYWPALVKCHAEDVDSRRSVETGPGQAGHVWERKTCGHSCSCRLTCVHEQLPAARPLPHNMLHTPRLVCTTHTHNTERNTINSRKLHFCQGRLYMASRKTNGATERWIVNAGVASSNEHSGIMYRNVKPQRSNPSPCAATRKSERLLPFMPEDLHSLLSQVVGQTSCFKTLSVVAQNDKAPLHYAQAEVDDQTYRRTFKRRCLGVSSRNN